MTSGSRNGTVRVARLLALAAVGLAEAGHASAQFGSESDLRNIQPFVMLIVDTSGSMERVPGCYCSSPSCTECMPACSRNGVDPPSYQRSLWAMTLETLTGTFTSYQCNDVPRTVANGATYDLAYPFPYHQPWHCPGGALVCAYPGQATAPQRVPSDGVLDVWGATTRFGLMTFDGKETYKGGNPLIPIAQFSDTLSEAIEGMWSYGGKKTFRYPGCNETYVMDTGVRSKTAAEGTLVSVDYSACANPPCDMFEINAAIQSALLNARPYGGTPIAGALEDLYYHYSTDLSDSFGSCRRRYAVLLTDGKPDSDYRGDDGNCDCTTFADCNNDDPNLYDCPYDLPETIAYDLVTGRGADGKQLERLAVIGVGIDLNAPPAAPSHLDEYQATIEALDRIAKSGGSPDYVVTDPAYPDNSGTPTPHNARFVSLSDPNALRTALDDLLRGGLNAVTRTVPAFVTGLSGAQYEITTGFELRPSPLLPSGFALPWSGIIERRSFTCNNGVAVPVALDVASPADRFDVRLNSSDGNTRTLWTVVPPSATTSVMNGAIARGSGEACPAGCADVALDDNSVSIALLGLAAPEDTSTWRDYVMNWMYGRASETDGDGYDDLGRVDNRLGDIYHSSPAVAESPKFDAADPAYTLFRQRTGVEGRPVMMYVGSNDGILHAFNVEDYDDGAGNTYAAGHELWGFVPPYFIDKLRAQLSGHVPRVDGTPVVKDVYFKRDPTQPPVDDYHTVLIAGMRSGGHAYVALDVSDPTAPEFLWQFTDPAIGLTYGQPTIIHALVEFDEGDGSGATTTQRAVAILPGGLGVRHTTGSAGASALGCEPAFGLTAQTLQGAGGESFGALAAMPAQGDPAGPATYPIRNTVPCWEGEGRSLYFVDVGTGKLIKKLVFNTLDSAGSGRLFPSPIPGTPAAYPDALGTLANRGYVLDADGVIWRIDLSQSDPVPNDAKSGWTARPYHDIFHGLQPTQGETSYERPILSLDGAGNMVVLMGTGDTDNFDKPNVNNRVVSLTEWTPPSPSPDAYRPVLNWELGQAGSGLSFVTSELVTGSMALFEKQLFIASFIAVTNSTNACDIGAGRLWSLDYVAHSAATNTNGTSQPQPISAVASTQTSTTSLAHLFNIAPANAEENLLVMGLGTTRRSCSIATLPTTTDPYFGYTLPEITQAAASSVWLVANTQSDNANQLLAGSVLGTSETELTRPMSFARVTSWAPNID